jgi:hypothetical protein
MDRSTACTRRPAIGIIKDVIAAPELHHFHLALHSQLLAVFRHDINCG